MQYVFFQIFIVIAFGVFYLHHLYTYKCYDLRVCSGIRILSAPERKVQRREIETAGGRNEIFFTVFWKHLRNFREYFCNDTITKSS